MKEELRRSLLKNATIWIQDRNMWGFKCLDSGNVDLLEANTTSDPSKFQPNSGLWKLPNPKTYVKACGSWRRQATFTIFYKVSYYSSISELHLKVIR